MSQHESDEYWEDAYINHRAAGRSEKKARELADEDLEIWLEKFD